MTEAEVMEKIAAFIRTEFLDGDSAGELTETTPLLEWGVLNSMKTMVLLTHIRAELGVKVPATKINPQDLKNLRNIASMVCELAAKSAV